MNVKKLALGAYQTNCYLLFNATEALVIDPGYEADTILDALQGRKLRTILLTHTYGEGDTVSPIDGVELTVLHTPGHTPGSVCLIWGDQMFSGDTLFEGSCGRVDLPGGDPRVMLQSLRRLASLQADYHVHPGHGGSTTLSGEKQYNPYLR